MNVQIVCYRSILTIFLCYLITIPSATASEKSDDEYWLWSAIQSFIDTRKDRIPAAQPVIEARQQVATLDNQRWPTLSLDGDRSIAVDDRDLPIEFDQIHTGSISLSTNYGLFNPLLNANRGLSTSKHKLASSHLDNQLQEEAMEMLIRLLDIATTNETLIYQDQYKNSLLRSQELANASIKAGFGTFLALTELKLARSQALRVNRETLQKRSLLLQELENRFGFLPDLPNEYANLTLEDLDQRLNIEEHSKLCDVQSLSVQLAENQLDVANSNYHVIAADTQPTVELYASITRQFTNTDPSNRYINSKNIGVRFRWEFGKSFHSSTKKAAANLISLAEQALADQLLEAKYRCQAAKTKYIDAIWTDKLLLQELQDSYDYANYIRKRFQIAGLQTVSIQQLVSTETSLYETHEISLRSKRGVIQAHWELAHALRLIGVTNATFFILD